MTTGLTPSGEEKWQRSFFCVKHRLSMVSCAKSLPVAASEGFNNVRGGHFAHFLPGVKIF
jgi:hypothetical protein